MSALLVREGAWVCVNVLRMVTADMSFHLTYTLINIVVIVIVIISRSIK